MDIIPTTEQVKGQLQTFIAGSGGIIAGFVVGKGWVTQEQAVVFLHDPMILGIVAWAIVQVWVFVDRTKKRMVAAVDALPEVAGVITKPTLAGHELAEAIPSTTVVPAGTIAAGKVAVSTEEKKDGLH